MNGSPLPACSPRGSRETLDTLLRRVPNPAARTIACMGEFLLQSAKDRGDSDYEIGVADAARCRGKLAAFAVLRSEDAIRAEQNREGSRVYLMASCTALIRSVPR